MTPTPYQTYLAERLQSARCLGWEGAKTGANNKLALQMPKAQVNEFPSGVRRLLNFWTRLRAAH